MSKRSLEEENLKNTKIQRILSETSVESLPDEMLNKIFSQFEYTEDFRNCMLVCSRFHNLIVNSSNFWKNILIDFQFEENLEEILSFLMKYGEKVKNIRIYGAENLSPILSLVPNLEYLSCTTYKFYDGEPATIPINSQFSLPNLKVLMIFGETGTFIRNARDINHLEIIKITDDYKNNFEIFTNFIVEQQSLKELHITHDRMYITKGFIFPTRDISTECKFQLSSFSHSFRHPYKADQNFIKFLASQVENLTNLILQGFIRAHIIDLIFKRGKKLEILIISPNVYNEELFDLNISSCVLPSVKFFGTLTFPKNNFYEIFKRFPNIVSLKFGSLKIETNETFPQIQSFGIHSSYFLPSKLEMPSLKKLTLNNFERKNEILEKFCEINSNIEILIYDTQCPRMSSDLGFLKFFKKLNIFEVYFWQPSSLRILVEFSEKVVYFDRRFKDNLEVFRKTFPDFKVVEKKFNKTYSYRCENWLGERPPTLGFSN